MTKIEAYGLSDVGRKRTRNEDSFLVNPDINLIMIADGMGGHSGGEYASKLAVSTIEEVLHGMSGDPEATVISGVNTEEADYGDRLRYAIELASSKIYDRARFDPQLKGMGTTVVSILFNEGRMYIANVGDSRAYYFHANKMKQITVDHSVVYEQMQAGLIEKKDMKGHRLKNVITRSVGYSEEVEIDVQHLEVHMGDKILLCSDGLTNMVPDEEISKIVVGHSPKEACRKLVDMANEKGGEDNITVVLAEVVEI